VSVNVVVKPSVMRVTLIVCWGEVVGVLAGCCLSVCGGLIGMFQTCCSVGCGVSGLVVALVPAYNEGRYVASVLVRLREYVDRVIVCDDGSVSLVGRSGGRGGGGGQA